LPMPMLRGWSMTWLEWIFVVVFLLILGTPFICRYVAKKDYEEFKERAIANIQVGNGGDDEDDNGNGGCFG